MEINILFACQYAPLGEINDQKYMWLGHQHVTCRLAYLCNRLFSKNGHYNISSPTCSSRSFPLPYQETDSIFIAIETEWPL